MSSVFEGDPKLILGPNGADLAMDGAQPVMDQGLENRSHLELFGGDDWAGNALLVKKSQKYQGRFGRLSKGLAITSANIGKMRMAALADLKSLVDEHVAKQVDVVVRNVESNKLGITITIVRPTGETSIIQYHRSGELWLRQASSPAIARVAQ